MAFGDGRAVHFNFDIVDHNNPFLGSRKFLVRVRSIESTLTDYEIAHGFPATESAEPLVPDILRNQIAAATGIEHKYIRVDKFYFNQADYVVKLRGPQECLMFKMVYYGAGI